MRSFALRPLLVVAGAYHLALGAFMFLAPREFYDRTAGFPPYNDHFVRDAAAFVLALGIVLLIASVRTSWQEPVLTVTVIWYAVHVLNHLIDIGDTDPGWHGPFTLVVLIAFGLGLAWLLRTVSGRGRPREREPEPPRPDRPLE